MQTDDTSRTLVRNMADALGCLIEEDFQLLAAATAGTVEAWRKRGKGPAYILLGNRYLYPKEAVADFLRCQVRERRQALSAREVL